MDGLTIALFYLGLPGLVSGWLVSVLIVHKPWEMHTYLLYAFFLSLSSYLILDATQFGGENGLSVWAAIIKPDSPVNSNEIFAAVGIGVILAIIVSYIINFKVINKISQIIRCSKKYGDESLFMHFLNFKETDWVYIRDEERDLIFQGKVHSYSETDSLQEIVLTESTVFAYYGQEMLYEASVIYIAREPGKLLIEHIPKHRFGEPSNVQSPQNVDRSSPTQ